MCLFFDQVNIYAILRGLISQRGASSTDLSTDFVDKLAWGRVVVVGQRLTSAYVVNVVCLRDRAYDARP